MFGQNNNELSPQKGVKYFFCLCKKKIVLNTPCPVTKFVEIIDQKTSVKSKLLSACKHLVILYANFKLTINSLIELMIVVVIIGILSAVAVPQYQKFQAKARQAEAKSNLSGIYTAMTAFHAEWTEYYADFRAIGFGLNGDLGYDVGFGGAGIPGPAQHPNATFAGNAAAQFKASNYLGGGFNLKLGATKGSASLITAYTTTAKVFTAGAAGDLDNDATIDIWTINQDKDYTQVGDDVSQ